ncbi:MAG: MOSC domain-containing protein [Verrucomicrobiota bacterium]
MTQIELLHCYLSPGHNYVGHHGGPAGVHPIWEMGSLECVAGRGVKGDRYFDHKENYKGQVTFFAIEEYEALCRQTGVNKPPYAFRRNIITRGVDLNSLIGCEFEIQGVRFHGVESCKPCYWMDEAFAPGTEAALRGRGGLRARILTSGTLQRTVAPVELRVRRVEELAAA